MADLKNDFIQARRESRKNINTTIFWDYNVFGFLKTPLENSIARSKAQNDGNYINTGYNIGCRTMCERLGFEPFEPVGLVLSNGKRNRFYSYMQNIGPEGNSDNWAYYIQRFAEFLKGSNGKIRIEFLAMSHGTSGDFQYLRQVNSLFSNVAFEGRREEIRDIIFPKNPRIGFSSERTTAVLLNLAALGISMDGLKAVKRMLDNPANTELSLKSRNFICKAIYDIQTVLHKDNQNYASVDARLVKARDITHVFDQFVTQYCNVGVTVEELAMNWTLARSATFNPADLPMFFETVNDQARSKDDKVLLKSIVTDSAWRNSNLRQYVKSYDKTLPAVHIKALLDCQKANSAVFRSLIKNTDKKLSEEMAYAVSNALKYGCPEVVLQHALNSNRTPAEIDAIVSLMPGYQQEKDKIDPEKLFGKKTFQKLQSMMVNSDPDRLTTLMKTADAKTTGQSVTKFLKQLAEEARKPGERFDVPTKEAAEGMLKFYQNQGFDPEPFKKKGFSDAQIGFIAIGIIDRYNERQNVVDFWNLDPKMSLDELWEAVWTAADAAKASVKRDKPYNPGRQARTPSEDRITIIRNYHGSFEEKFVFSNMTDLLRKIGDAIRTNDDPVFWQYVNHKVLGENYQTLCISEFENIYTEELKEEVKALQNGEGPKKDPNIKILTAEEFSQYLKANPGIDKEQAQIALIAQNTFVSGSVRALGGYYTSLNKIRAERGLTDRVIAHYLAAKDPENAANLSFRAVSDWCIGKVIVPYWAQDHLGALLGIPGFDVHERSIKISGIYQAESDQTQVYTHADMQKPDFDENLYHIPEGIQQPEQVTSKETNNGHESPNEL